MSRRAASLPPSGRNPTGVRTIRDCSAPRRSTTQPGSFSPITGSAAKSGAPTALRGWRGAEFLAAAALDGVSFRAPAQHTAGQIGDIGETVLLQDGEGLGRTAAGPADGDDRPVAAQFTGATGQLAERNQNRVRDMAERPGEFGRVAHVP